MELVLGIACPCVLPCVSIRGRGAGKKDLGGFAGTLEFCSFCGHDINRGSMRAACAEERPSNKANSSVEGGLAFKSQPTTKFNKGRRHV